MGLHPLHNVNFDALKEFHHITDEILNNCTVYEILKLNNAMLIHKKQQEFNANSQDAEYKRIVKTYFTPFAFLNQFWSEDEIVMACAKHLKISDIVEEYNVPCKNIRTTPEEFAKTRKYEYIQTANAHVPRFTKSGEQLLYGDYTRCHIFRKTHKYQGTKHGKVILELLYQTHPELRQFEFSAYEYYESENTKYEIYPKNLFCYTPLHALMTKDIDAIICRNQDYCKLYNNGVYSLESWNQRVKSPEIQHYFDVIRTLS